MEKPGELMPQDSCQVWLARMFNVGSAGGMWVGGIRSTIISPYDPRSTACLLRQHGLEITDTTAVFAT